LPFSQLLPLNMRPFLLQYPLVQISILGGSTFCDAPIYREALDDRSNGLPL
jgi:hypothetical protein